jgi:hypothetical protein
VALISLLCLVSQQFTCKEEEEEENMTVEVPFGSDNIPCLEVAAPNCKLTNFHIPLSFA